MERYRVVRRRPVVSRIEAALRESGAEVLQAADPNRAPFEFTIRMPEEASGSTWCATPSRRTNTARAGDQRTSTASKSSMGASSTGTTRSSSIRRGTRSRSCSACISSRGCSSRSTRGCTRRPGSRAPSSSRRHDLRTASEKGWHGWQRERSHARRKQPAAGGEPSKPRQSSDFDRTSSCATSSSSVWQAASTAVRGCCCRIGSRRSLAGRQLLVARLESRHPLELQLGLPAQRDPRHHLRCVQACGCGSRRCCGAPSPEPLRQVPACGTSATSSKTANRTSKWSTGGSRS